MPREAMHCNGEGRPINQMIVGLWLLSKVGNAARLSGCRESTCVRCIGLLHTIGIRRYRLFLRCGLFCADFWLGYMQERGKGQSDRTGGELVTHGKAALEMMTTIMMLEGGLGVVGWFLPGKVRRELKGKNQRGTGRQGRVHQG
jgi:hypothetical protein